MNEKELEAIQLLSITLYSAPVVVLIETDETAFSLLEKNPYFVLMAINRHYAESQESIIRINGDADVVGRSWIFPVDMVIIEEPMSEEAFAERIDTWLPRIVSHGIFACLHYEEEGYEYVKEVVDQKMADFEQVARAGTLAAYRIKDPATDISWDMISKSHKRHEVVH